MNLLWEFLKFPFAISAECYRLLIFRYIFLIAFGCYTAIYGFTNIKVNVISVLGAMIGLVFIILTQYAKYTPIIFTNWTSTCLVAAMLIIPLFNLIVLKMPRPPKIFKPIELIGKASYNIYFVQMVYYYFVSHLVEILIGVRWVAFTVNIVVCVLVGIIFYLIETPITKKVNTVIAKHLK
ncbi:MAG: hypothetical protein NC133_02675 [Prevotella sp.]|nr:hypothetical protein [Prevotella sp.]